MLPLTEKGARLEKLLSERIVFLDGAMGTIIQRLGLSETDFRKGDPRLEKIAGQLAGDNDILSLTRPDVIEKIHLDYYLAGSDIATTNTFAATPMAQADYSLGEDLIADLNRASVGCARRAARCDAPVLHRQSILCTARGKRQDGLLPHGRARKRLRRGLDICPRHPFAVALKRSSCDEAQPVLCLRNGEGAL